MNNTMDNIHVSQTPIKQKEQYLNSFNIKTVDNVEKGNTDHGIQFIFQAALRLDNLTKYILRSWIRIWNKSKR